MADEPTRSAAPVPWPTVAEQLRQSGVRPGTALEALILANQDFEMLRPEEAHDNLRIPPWLRVHFLKNHPDYTYTPGDPTGGYPLVLRDLYVWMIRNQDLPVQQGTQAGQGGGRVGN